jgi:hypothetical protein
VDGLRARIIHRSSAHQSAEADTERDALLDDMRTMIDQERAEFFRQVQAVLDDGLALAEGFALAIGPCSPAEVMTTWLRVMKSRLTD